MIAAIQAMERTAARPYLTRKPEHAEEVFNIVVVRSIEATVETAVNQRNRRTTRTMRAIEQ